jgi:NAD(P) transhydrogenase
MPEVMGRCDGEEYDLIAIGSGPAGTHAALQAARLGKRAALVERAEIGGAYANSGTVPARTIGAAIDALAAHAGSAFGRRQPGDRITVDDLLWRTQAVVEAERDAISDSIRRGGVRVIHGDASFVDPHTLEIRSSGRSRLVRARRIVIAVGTVPVRPPGVRFDEDTVIDSDQIVRLRRLPRTLIIVGGGIVGLEYASMAAALGVRVMVVDKREHLLEFVDDDLVSELQYHLRGLGVVFRLGQEADAARRMGEMQAITRLRSGEEHRAEMVLFAAGRNGATKDLRLAAVGVRPDARGRISVDSEFRTAQRHIFAAGDVVGSTSLVATAISQGRQAALAAFGRQPLRGAGGLPEAIHTIPALSFVGSGERELTAAGIPYVVGVAKYRDLSHSEISGVRFGLLKLLIHSVNRRLLGVHIFGTAATELVHIGQSAIAGGLPVDYFAEAALNVPSFSAGYQVAAASAMRQLGEPGGATNARGCAGR